MEENRKIFWSVFSGVLLLIFFSFYVFFTFGENGVNMEREEYFEDVLDSQSGKLDGYFSGMEEFVSDLASMQDSRDILEAPLIFSKEAAILDVGQKSIEFRMDVENYLDVNSNMTTEDLLASEEFRSVAFRPVGAKGYSIFGGLDKTVFYFHPDPRFVGDITQRAGGAESAKNIFIEMANTGYGSGFYPWEDLEGNVREKYSEFFLLNRTSADGERFFLGATNYIDDYEVANISDSLKVKFSDIVSENNYHNVLFMSKGGRIVFMGRQMEGLGVSVYDARTGMEEVYEAGEFLDKGEVGFFGPFWGHSGMSLHLGMISKVYDGDKFLGYVVVLDEMDNIWNLVVDGVGFGEIYLVNKDKLLISENENNSVFLQRADSYIVDECLAYFGGGEYVLSVLDYVDYAGKEALGSYVPVDRFKWCLIYEVDLVDSDLVSFGEGYSKIVVLGGILLVILLSIFAFLFDKKVLCSYGRKCFLKEFVLRTKRLIARLNYLEAVFVILIFLGLYFALLYYLFGDFESFNLLNDLIDFPVLGIGMLFIFYSIKSCGPEASKILFFSGVLICIGRMIEIAFQEYQSITGIFLGGVLWSFVFGMSFLGYFLLMVGFRRLQDAR